MIATELPTLITDSGPIAAVLVLAALFAVLTVALMVKDYRSDLENNWNERPSFADFIAREQLYIYLILLFLVLVGAELWLQTQR